MLRKFKVSGFRNFERELTLDLSNVRDYSFSKSLIVEGTVNKALVYGANGSGKSNLGLALMDMAIHLSDKIRNPALYQTGYLSASSAKEEASFTYVLSLPGGGEVTYSYLKASPRDLLYEEVSVDGKSLLSYDHRSGRYLNRFEELSSLRFEYLTPGVSAIKFARNNSLLGKGHPLSTIVEFAENMLWFRSVRQNEFMGMVESGESMADFIVREGLLKDFEAFLRDLGLDFDLSTARDPLGNVLLMVDYPTGKSLEFFSSVSTGTASLALFYYWMRKCAERVSFLFVDEFDAFYHVKLARKILESVNSYPFQSVLTTHNSYLADNSLMRPDCYFLLKGGGIRSFADSTRKTIREANSLENMLLGNEFDAA